jgi:hypothetical protein
MGRADAPYRRGDSSKPVGQRSGETAHDNDVELIEHWNLTDPHIMAVLLAMRTDLDSGSPAGRLYGESLATALAVYLLNRYAVRRHAPVAYRGSLPRYRLKRVLDYIGDNLANDLSRKSLDYLLNEWIFAGQPIWHLREVYCLGFVLRGIDGGRAIQRVGRIRSSRPRVKVPSA